VNLGYATSGPFALAPTPPNLAGCGPVLGAGGACAIAVTFTPTQAGGASGALTITSDASNPTVTVALSGTGVVAPPLRALTVASRLDFGLQPFGQRSGGQALTLANALSQAVTITDIVPSGDFSVDEGCAVVPARGTCTVNVYFTPSARGARAGTLTITVPGETQPYVVTLSGEGAPNPNPLLQLSPSFIGFGNALIGPSGESAIARLTNIGEVPVALSAIGSAADFLLTSHCGATLEVGASCTIDVLFYPRLIGLRVATIEVHSNATNGPHRLDLSGVGCSLPNVARSRIPQLVCNP
jgi:hypothetical protein